MAHVFENAKVALPSHSRLKAMEKLFDNQAKTQKIIDTELPVFQLYVNTAIKNIQDIARGVVSESYDSEAIAAQLRRPDEKTKKVIEKLANFFWLFQVDDPGADFKEQEYRAYTIAMVKQLFLLRNFFCHQNQPGIDALLVNHSFYKFFSGWLCNEARQHATGAGLKTDKLFKMKVMNPQLFCRESADEMAPLVNEECTYALTRKGIILLVCLALFRDEAIEFCQSLHDLKLLRRDIEEELEEMPETERDSELLKLRKKSGSRKAFHEFFTYFSMRRSYNAIKDPEERNFACFTDIIGYLNKVPGVAMDYLALAKERQFLADKEAQSTESADNKASKYQLHRRWKKRALAFLAGYCEDFDIVPAMRFKRLDVSEMIGRKRYRFGLENATDCRQNRHYAIIDDAIRFEYRPQQHYGDIRIDSLRSAISLDELRRLLIAHESNVFKANEEVEKYFAAYHRILEKMLAEKSCDFIDREAYLPDLTTVTGATAEELRQDDTFKAKMAPFFPANLTRFFIPQDNIPSDTELATQLQENINREITQDETLLDAFKTARNWRRQDPEQRPRLDDSCRFSDGTLIHHVFRTLNLHLTPERKYRQLPRGKQHRDLKDVEFQMMHATIGRFPLDQHPFWDALKGVKSVYTYESKGNREVKKRTGEVSLPEEKCRPELKEVTADLQKAFRELMSESEKYLATHPRLDANGNKMRSAPSLMMLAEAAVQCHRDFCRKKLTQIKAVKSWERNSLESECRRFGLRVGQPLAHEAILKTILHIDLANWSQAFNYQEGKKWCDRNLMDDGHVVAQIPVTNFFTAQRCLAQQNHPSHRSLFAEGRFQFGKALQERLKTKIALRDFYDGTPLLACRSHGCLQGTAWDPTLSDDFRRELPLPDKRELFQKATELLDIQAQDLLLIHVAKKYHDRYAQTTDGAKLGAELDAKHDFLANGSVYEYFDNPETLTLDGGLKIIVRPNDRLRLLFAKIQKYAKELADTYSPEEKKTPVDFYDVAAKFRRIEARDRRLRLSIQAKIYQLESMVDEPNLDANLSPDERQRRLYAAYLPRVCAKPNKREAKLPFADFGKLVAFHNKVFHDGFNLSDAEAKEAHKILSCFGIVDEQRR